MNTEVSKGNSMSLHHLRTKFISLTAVVIKEETTLFAPSSLDESRAPALMSVDCAKFVQKCNKNPFY